MLWWAKRHPLNPSCWAGVRIARGLAVASLSVGAGAAIELAVKPEVTADAAGRLRDDPEAAIAEAKVAYLFLGNGLQLRLHFLVVVDRHHTAKRMVVNTNASASRYSSIPDVPHNN